MKSLIKSPDLWAVLSLAAWFLIYYLPVTIGQQVFSEGDILWGNMPIRSEVTRALAEKRLPLWTPLLQGGLPLFAEGHTAALYPLNLVLHSLLPPASAISYVILFNLCWVAIGMYFFIRACGLRVSSALLAGLAFGASGAVIARVSHLDVLTPISWLPWLMLFQVKYWKARFEGHQGYYWFALGCIVIGVQFLTGSPALIALNLIAYVSCGFFAGILWASPTKTDRKALFNALSKRFIEVMAVTIGSMILGLGLGAAQLLPTAELIGWSIRGKELGRAFFTSYSLDPAALSQFIAPFAVMASPSADNMEFWGYLGVFPLLIGLAAIFLRRDFRAWFFLLFAAIALSLALGGSNPFYEWLYYVPVFNRFRVPARFLFLFLFAITFLAATGLDQIQNNLRETGNKALAYTLGIPSILLAVSVTLFLGYNRPIEFWMDAWQWLPVFCVVLSVAILISAARQRISRQVFQVLAVGLTCLDLAAFGAPFLTTLDRTTAPLELALVPRTVLAMDSREPIARSLVMEFPSVTPAAIRATLWSGMPMTYGRAGIIRGYMPFSLALGRNEDYIKDMTLPMRNLMGIRYYLLPLETAPSTAASPLDQAQPADGLNLELLSRQSSIAPTRAKYLRVVSYTDQTIELPNGFQAGEIDLTLNDASHRVLPIRLGVETADWAYEGIKQIATVRHSQPTEIQSFPAYLRSVGREFNGAKYVARLDISPLNIPSVVTALAVQSFLPGVGLTIEHIDFVDENDHSASLSALLRQNDLALAFRGPTAAMWDNRDVMPRAFVVHTAEIVDDSQALDRMRSPEFDPSQRILLSDAQTVDPVPNASDAGPSQADIIDYKSDRVVIQVKTGREGYLVLADSWYPGWVAIVDQVAVPILRADYIFRAVPIQPGEHRVEFQYHPGSFSAGVLVSGASLFVLVLFVVMRQRSVV